MANHPDEFRDALTLAKTADAGASLALEACRRATEVHLRYWQALHSNDVQEKSAGDLVTKADLETERIVSDFLEREMPEAGIICEEGTSREGKGLVWYLDPLDGTTNFVQRFPVFAVSLGLAETTPNGPPRLLCGVVWNPVSREIFWGARGKGSYLGSRRLRVAEKTRFGDAMVATGFPRRYGNELEPFLREFALIFPRVRAIRRAGSAALDLCWTAQGIFDGFWEHRLSPWDIAAGALIVEEAGGECCDFRGTDQYLANGNIVGASPLVKHELLRCLAEANGWPVPE